MPDRGAGSKPCRGGVGSAFRVGIRAGDILLATAPPVGLSARNVIPGRITSLRQLDVIVSARVKYRIEMEVHLTLAARDSLQLAPGKEVNLPLQDDNKGKPRGACTVMIFGVK